MIVDRAPHYKKPFDELEKISQLDTNHYQNFKYTFRYLELLEYRLKTEIEIFKEIQIEREKAISYEDNIEVGNKLFGIIELIQLDVESFYLFARILYDRIPYIIMPLEYLVVKKEGKPKRGTFHSYLNWFQKHEDMALDTDYVNLLNKIKPFFIENIKNPRDEIIVHPKNRSFIQGTDMEGNVIRQEIKDVNEFDNNKGIHKFDNVTSLMHNILDNLSVLENYYLRKIKIKS